VLAKHSKGLIALSACLRGPVTEAVVDQKCDQARENAYRLRDVFGKGNFFLEIQDQGLPIEKDVNRELVRLSKETGIPLVATNDCHYLHHEDAHAQEVLEIMAIVGGDKRDSRFFRKTDQLAIDIFFDRQSLILNFQEEIALAENVAQAVSILSRLIALLIHHCFRHRPAKAGR